MEEAKIITVSSSKGGVCKTTTLMSLADYFATQGHRVAVIDTDPNKSLTRWYKKGEKNGFYEGIEFRQELNDKAIIRTAKELAGKSEILFIDVAGIASVSLIKAAGIADLVIIPVQPSEDDFLEAVNTMGIVKEAEELTRTKIPCRTVLTRAKQGTVVLEHTIKQLQKINFPVFNTVLMDRTIYSKARFKGATPVSYNRDQEAYEEIGALAGEVEKFLFSKTNERIAA